MKQIAKFLLMLTDDVLIVIILIIFLYYLRADTWVYIVLVVIMVIISIFTTYIFLPQLQKPVTGIERMIGTSGEALETLKPRGSVRIKGEIWDATSIDGKIKKGEKIVVEEINGLKVLVKKLEK
jgi:membrane-bound serine protease (ClpP class)